MNSKLDILVDAPALRYLGFVAESSPAAGALAAPRPRKTAPSRDGTREPTAGECHLLATALHPHGADGACWLDHPLTTSDCYGILDRSVNKRRSNRPGE